MKLHTNDGSALFKKDATFIPDLAAITQLSGYYRLKTMFRGDGECLEGNQATSKVHGGNAFMDKCQNVSGQLWKFEPAGNGYYRMKTQFRGDGECLEGNQASSKVHDGAAFMDKCQNVSGQLWRWSLLVASTTV